MDETDFVFWNGVAWAVGYVVAIAACCFIMYGAWKERE